MTEPDTAIQDLARRRWRVAMTLTATMVALYFGFILLVAFNKPLLGRLIAPGLSLGVVLGALVIVVSWILTWIYVRWANRHYDTALRELRAGSRR
ncbi:MAG TPA: DUF485 domain-containing protein [Gemmatimonadaceae bacterium]